MAFFERNQELFRTLILIGTSGAVPNSVYVHTTQIKSFILLKVFINLIRYITVSHQHESNCIIIHKLIIDMLIHFIVWQT